MNIKVSIGEIFDKLSILRIKLERIKDEKKLLNIGTEEKYLAQIISKDFHSILLSPHYEELLITNKKLWEIEDELREMEHNNCFDEKFIETARQVYKLNDYRAQLKKRINQGYGSEFTEEKSYSNY